MVVPVLMTMPSRARPSSMINITPSSLQGVTHTASSWQASIKALYGFSPGLILTPERSSSLFLASVDSSAGLIFTLP